MLKNMQEKTTQFNHRHFQGGLSSFFVVMFCFLHIIHSNVSEIPTGKHRYMSTSLNKPQTSRVHLLRFGMTGPQKICPKSTLHLRKYMTGRLGGSLLFFLSTCTSKFLHHPLQTQLQLTAGPTKPPSNSFRLWVHCLAVLKWDGQSRPKGPTSRSPGGEQKHSQHKPPKSNIAIQNDAIFAAVSIHLPRPIICCL